MSAQILDGKKIAGEIREQIHQEVEQLLAAGHRQPGLAVVQVGDDPASSVYVRNKHNACDKAGILSIKHNLSVETTEETLISLVEELNEDATVDGILVQLPLPDHIDPETVIERIHPDKDVDGFHPYNMGRLALKMPLLRPCTPKGVMTLLERTGIPLEGKEAVIVGASNIVGRPMTLELLSARCTTTTCHSKTADLEAHVRRAEVLVVGVGIPNFIPGEWVRDGAVVIDVGINRLEDNTLTGDVDYEGAFQHASWITPVPGGVGPMTIATLLQNTLKAAEVFHNA
ncbi:MAG: bifunctional methylenetetrahydrofolate dehydrogenase/methenyltetrahydrofolate cyclohydrolase FolD [Gammaproteobacteria bacterium]|jgi:methylenetetrahydrofolate dehydrogenase (NADP+)/methenyltetrahydrofolate cyclohydrolase|nr:bifunctional methylenetetrahydrofolate dehydrogenase/methenyltetrahydrofolate cyclohydrolase FolD [Gammaproteobacteria bacterium]MBT4607757.1 bifunctional methylenetetrahydrofolate dehydrogenase/methenyltetrahydrofolate cyclohydrolase FolD [Thiotrichales bacterium]MBT3473034.1 bifunctional methylenetetrahydrofolate dehydrogenase/methenyltetrahydrofolate cyclohydrolase FolD [Gammaproteobacteria bacterium]MBT3968224.1 bifunctional methylenetetrahydrofolate dehydrogenase/methenyltetrahydrofolate